MKRFQHQQVQIATDDRGAFTSQRCRQHDIVVTVATHWRLERVRRYQGERLAELPNRASRIHRALMKFSSQDIAQLVDERSGGNDDVMADAVLQKLATDAARDEGRDEDVRVEEQLTRRG